MVGQRVGKAARLLAIPFSATGLLGAALAFAASLTPSLYPRPWLVQGVLSGAALATGYGVGTAVSAIARRTIPLAPAPRVRAAGLVSARVLTACGALAALLWNAAWQVDARRLLGLDQRAGWYLLAVTAVAVLTAYLLVVAGRASRAAHRAYVRLLARTLPARGVHPVRVLLTVLVLLLLVSGLPLDWAMGAAGRALTAADARIEPDVPPPATTYRAGGPGSLIPWETLGSSGRRFVSQGPAVTDLEAWWGQPVVEPIRVYVGERSAASDGARARLAVAELERLGAFAREVLVVITPTGSGSINPYAIDPLEYMYRGNTAAVAFQYGHLPSWVTAAGNQERAQRGARALFGAVTRRLEDMPAGARPKLLVYGESLGSFGSESNFSDLDDVRERTDGVLWIGPTRGNLLWRDLTARRDRGSPVWQPVYDGGRRVRFGADGASLMQPGGDWPFPRVAYLQHPTDPITWHSPGILLERPEWLRSPRGPDVSEAIPHIPVLTAWQLTVDMALAETAPLGHGHMFGPEQAEAWALIAPPPGWSPGLTQDLVRLLAADRHG